MPTEASTIGPSGDTSGAADTAAIQASLDAASGAVDPTVILSGGYYINATLTVPSNVVLTGLRKSYVIWAGADDDTGYMIESQGPVANLTLNGNNKRRGLKITGVTYKEALTNIYCWGTAALGMYIENCWGASFRDLKLIDCAGSGIHAYQPNSTTFRNVIIAGDYSGSGAYGIKFDTCNLVSVETLTLENVVAGSNPIVVLEDVQGISVNSLRSEGNTGTGPIVHSTSSSAIYGYVTRINGMMHDGGGTFSCFVKADTRSEIVMTGTPTAGGYYTNPLVILDGGTHVTPVMEGNNAYAVENHDWLQLINNAEHSPGYRLPEGAVRHTGIELREMCKEVTTQSRTDYCRKVYAMDATAVSKGALYLRLLTAHAWYPYDGGYDLSEVDPETVANQMITAGFGSSEDGPVLLDIEQWSGNTETYECIKNIATGASMWRGGSSREMGIYSQMPIANHTDPTALKAWIDIGTQSKIDEYTANIGRWQDRNDIVTAQLGDYMDFLCPQVYRYQSDSTYWKWYASNQIMESLRLAKGKPVRPILWYYYHGGTACSEAEFIEMVQYVAAFPRIDGIIIHVQDASVGFDWTDVVQDLVEGTGSFVGSTRRDPPVTLTPSGDSTGAKDTEAIQSQLTQGKTVYLDGTFTVTSLTIPVNASLIGLGGGATLTRTGAATSDYFITVEGGGSGRKSCALENILLYGTTTCRMVLFQNLWYAPLYKNLKVMYGREVGVDFVSCWGSWGEGLTVYYTSGIGVRYWQCNSNTWTHTIVSNGVDATWPDAADTTVQDYAGRNVQTPAAKRAAMVCAGIEQNPTNAAVKCDLQHFDGLTMEGNGLTSKPLIATDATASTFSNIRFENNGMTGSAIIMEGDGNRRGTNVKFQQIAFSVGVGNGPTSLITLTGTTRNIHVDNMHAVGPASSFLSNGVIYCPSGTHYGPKVTNSYCNYHQQDEFIAGAGTITPGEPVWVGQHADADVGANSLFYSTDESKLAYKDPGGQEHVVSTEIYASGDSSGVTDLAAINAALSAYNSVTLAPGNFYVNGSIALDTNHQSLFGSGTSTLVVSVGNTVPVVQVTADYCKVAFIRLYGGTNCVHLNGATQAAIHHAYMTGATSHIVLLDGTMNNATIDTCVVGTSSGGDGINAIWDAGGRCGDRLAVRACSITGNAGYGIRFNSYGLTVDGQCYISSNTLGGIGVVTATSYGSTSINIRGNYIASNTGPQIHLDNTGGGYINGGVIEGNYMYAGSTYDGIKAEGAARTIGQFAIHGNYISAGDQSTTWRFNLSDVLGYSYIRGNNREHINCSNPDYNKVEEPQLLGRIRNVKDFGATGDGTTDDSAAIVAALAEGAGEIQFPAGTYLVSSTAISPQNNQTLRGLGAATIKLLNSYVNINNDDNVTIDNLTLNTDATTTTAYRNVISAVDANDLTINNVNIDGAELNTSGIYLLRGNRVSITNCRVIDCGDATNGHSAIFMDDTTNSVVSGNYIANAARSAIFLYTDCSDVHIDNNTIYQYMMKNAYEDGAIDMYGTGNDYVTITNNTIDTGTAASAQYHHAIRCLGNIDTVISGNTIRMRSSTQRYGITVGTRTATAQSGAVIANNTFYVTETMIAPIVVSAADRTVIEGNTVYISHSGAASSAIILLQAFASDDLTVTGNVCECNSKCVALLQTSITGTGEIAISNNVCRGFTGSMVAAGANTIASLTVTGNKYDTSGSDAFYVLTSTAELVLANNNFTGSITNSGNGTTIETVCGNIVDGALTESRLGDLTLAPSASLTPANNGELMIEATNNTTLTFKLKGSDGTVRSGTITLS